MTAKEILQQYVQKREEVKKCEKIKTEAENQLKIAQVEADKAEKELTSVELPVSYLIKELNKNDDKEFHYELSFSVLQKKDKFSNINYANVLENQTSAREARIYIQDSKDNPSKGITIAGYTTVPTSALPHLTVFQYMGFEYLEDDVRIWVRCHAPEEVTKDMTITLESDYVSRFKYLYDIVMNYDATKDNNLGE